MTDQRANPWLRLPERWEGLALTLLDRRTSFTADQYKNKIVKERLLDAMATPNIMALLESGGRLQGIDSEKIAERLVLDPSTVNRWIRGAVQPHARMFFGILVLALRVGVEDVELPHIKTVIWECVSSTMATIREKELGQGRKKPTREDFVLVRTLMRNPGADALVPEPGESGPSHKEACEMILAQVVLESVAKRPGIRRFDLDTVFSSIREWAEVYSLFRLGLLWEWRSLDDDAV